MGTRVAPTFANIFMADFEEKHVYTYPLRPQLWLRFIDDIFMLWDHGREPLNDFIQHLNVVHPTIKFTEEISELKVHFLDVWIIKEGLELHSDLFVKPTDSNMTLHFLSAHPKHCKEGKPYGQFLRLRRICTEKETFLKRAVVKAKQFLEPGYPRSLLLKDLIRAAHNQRTDLLHTMNAPSTQDQSKQQIMVTTSHPSFKGLRPIISTNWDTLSSCHKTTFIHQRQLVAGFRRQKSTRDLLVRVHTSHTHPRRAAHLQYLQYQTLQILYMPEHQWQNHSQNHGTDR